ncbi:regulatory signaling modulator protein AmpE [Haliea sp. E17]|uniref:regulatory signaling modulator protein AmpE n=1 Tax=Haliea sp. E17 TaxID=3401576 RepID=UPI003AAF94A2
MTFLALILALVLDQLTTFGDRLRRDGWFAHWQSLLAGLGVSGNAALLLAVVIPVLAAGVALHLLAAVLFGLPWIAAAGLLLLYSFGRLPLSALQERYRGHCRRGDFQGAWLEAEAALPGLSIELEQDAQQVHIAIERAFLYESYQRWFAVLFYFLVFGPLGAFTYRLCQLLGEEGGGHGVLLHWLDWLPSRALAATFTLTGDFSASVDDAWAACRSAAMPASQVLWRVSSAALGNAPAEADLSGQAAALQNEAQAALVRRAAVCWIAVIALLVIIG